MPAAHASTAQDQRARGSPRPLRLAPAFVLMAVGAGLFAVSVSLDEPSALLAGTNTPISADATDLVVINANNSPTLVRSPVDPNHLVVVNRVDTPRFSCAMHVSLDAGATWAPAEIPFPEGEEQPPRCFAPDAAFGADGTLYVSFVTLIGLGNTPNAGWIVTARPGQRTLSAPVRSLDRNAFQVRLSADPKTAGRLWLSYVDVEETATLGIASPGNPVQVVRSDDGGATWGEPAVVSPPGRSRVVAPSTAAGGDGRLWALYLDLGDDALDYSGAHEGRGGEAYDGTWSLVLARSDDDGATWQETVVDDAVVATQRIIVLFPPSPSLAVDPVRDRVYVAFADGRLDDADVRVWASTDGGATFGAGRRVNDTPPRDGTSQYLPELAVAPDGRVDVVYYDRRADAENVMNEVSLQSSGDGGRTWRPRVRLTDRGFDSRVGFLSERGLPDLGSRLAMVSTDQRALAVWPDTRAGTEASGKQDLARSVVAFEEGSSARGPMRVAGAVAAGLGLVLLAVALPRRSRPAATGDEG